MSQLCGLDYSLSRFFCAAAPANRWSFGTHRTAASAAAAKASKGPDHYVQLIERMGEDLSKAREANDRWEDERAALVARARDAEAAAAAKDAAVEAAGQAKDAAEGELAELHALLEQRNISVSLLKKMSQKNAKQAGAGGGASAPGATAGKENGPKRGRSAKTGGKWGQRRNGGPPGPTLKAGRAANAPSSANDAAGSGKKTRPKSSAPRYKNVKSRLGQPTASMRANSAHLRAKRERAGARR